MKTCMVKNCGKPRTKGVYCDLHYATQHARRIVDIAKHRAERYRNLLSTWGTPEQPETVSRKRRDL